LAKGTNHLSSLSATVASDGKFNLLQLQLSILMDEWCVIPLLIYEAASRLAQFQLRFLQPDEAGCSITAYTKPGERFPASRKAVGMGVLRVR
jgi:hypothetical protein